MRSRDIPNDQHTSQGILADLRVHELEGEIDVVGLFVSHPSVQVAGGENNVVQDPAALGEICLEPRLVEVLLASLKDELLVVLNARWSLVMALQSPLSIL